MKDVKQYLIIEQLNEKLSKFRTAEGVGKPSKGWLNAVRSAYRMSLRQLADRLNTSKQAAGKLEAREREGTISLNALSKAADALGMKLIYGFVPKERSLSYVIEQRAYELAESIVERTSTNMMLEGQENSEKRIKTAIAERAEELKNEIPKMLWD